MSRALDPFCSWGGLSGRISWKNNYLRLRPEHKQEFRPDHSARCARAGREAGWGVPTRARGWGTAFGVITTALQLALLCVWLAFQFKEAGSCDFFINKYL